MVKRAAHALIIVLTLIVGATAAAIIVTQTAWFKNWLRGYIVRETNQYLNGTVSIDRLGGNIFFGIEMENIGVSLDGQPVVAVKDIGLDYNVFELISSGLSVDNIRLNKPVIYLRREGDTWSLSRLIRKEAFEADRRGPGRPVSIGDIGISDGTFVVDGAVGTSGVEVPKRFDHLDARLSFKYEPVRYSIEISHVSFRGSEPALALNALSGGVSVRDDTVFIEKLAVRTAETSISVDGSVQHYLSQPMLNLQVTSDKLSVAEFAQILPALAGVHVQPAFELALNGPADRLSVDLNARSSAGHVIAKVMADVQAPRHSVAGDITVRHLDLAAILNDPRQKSDITASGRVDLSCEQTTGLQCVRGSVTVDAPRIAAAGYVAERVHAVARIDRGRVAVDARGAAYGANATARGQMSLPQGGRPFRYDLRGRARHVNLAKLPRSVNAPRATTDVNAEYHAAGVAPARDVQVDLRFEPSTVAGTRISAGSTAHVVIDGRDLRYRADANVAGLDLERIGREFNVPGLATPRYQSSLNGHIVAEGHGTDLDTLELSAQGTLHESSILGGRLPQMAFDATVSHDTVHVKATGAFAGFDPAVVSGRPAAHGDVTGTLDVDATLVHVSSGVTPDSVSGTVRGELQSSTIGDLAISRASVDADYRESIANIRTLDIAGRDVNVQASGVLALNENGQSNLRVRADSPSLAEVGRLFDQPLAGIGRVDATVTGNRRELKATGTLTGNGVKYGENGALTMTSEYTATVPDLSLADASFTADSHATFVTIAGQNINQVDGKTTYRQKQLDFDLSAKQPARSVDGTGSLVLHPDHQEVHLQKLALQTAGTTWQLEPQSSATIKYARDTVSVSGLRLVSGDQGIGAEGTFGRPGDALHVTAENVNLASVDALLLRPQQLTGRLNGTGTVTADPSGAASGSSRTPLVDARFQIDGGGFRKYRYDTFGGTLNYTGHGVTLDTKLQQNATTYITAKGYVPAVAFTARSAGEREAAHGAAAAEHDRFDLHVESTPIDLGLVQGLTDVVTNVTGTFQANVDITGTAADPHPAGTIDLQNAAFTVEPTGVSYQKLRGRIDLQPDKIHIDHISVLDNHQSALSLTGDLAVHERAIGGMHLWVTADDFKVIDNKLGNVRVNSRMEVTGELRAPRLEGDLSVSTGQVNLDEIIGRLGTSAYATTPTEYEEAAAVEGQTRAPELFDALSMDVRLTVPDDLVIKSADLRGTSDSPIGLGTMTVTLGGDLRATKDSGQPPRLVGVVNTVRGTYAFQGRQFEILRDGTVRFVGEPLTAMDPVLDIRARRVIQAVEARVNVRGSMRQPEIQLSSTPPLEDADILSLIVFNQPINQLGAGDQLSLAARAQAITGGAITGQLSRSIGSALNLDTFELNVAPEGGGGEVTLGQQVGQNLYVKVQQGIGDQSQTNVVLEYEILKWLRLQTNVRQGSSTQQQLFQRAQGSGVDLLFFFSY